MVLCHLGHPCSVASTLHSCSLAQMLTAKTEHNFHQHHKLQPMPTVKTGQHINSSNMICCFAVLLYRYDQMMDEKKTKKPSLHDITSNWWQSLQSLRYQHPSPAPSQVPAPWPSRSPHRYWQSKSANVRLCELAFIQTFSLAPVEFRQWASTVFASHVPALFQFLIMEKCITKHFMGGGGCTVVFVATY